jgi:hypothetical protein
MVKFFNMIGLGRTARGPFNSVIPAPHCLSDFQNLMQICKQSGFSCFIMHLNGISSLTFVNDAVSLFFNVISSTHKYLYALEGNKYVLSIA